MESLNATKSSPFLGYVKTEWDLHTFKSSFVFSPEKLVFDTKSFAESLSFYYISLLIILLFEKFSLKQSEIHSVSMSLGQATS